MLDQEDKKIGHRDLHIKSAISVKLLPATEYEHNQN